MTTISARLEELGITLPEPVAPVANYVPYVITGNLVVISGQISINSDGLLQGTLGGDLSTPQGIVAARASGLNLLAQLNAACRSVGKSLDDVVRVVRLGGFVASTPSFFDQPQVINGVSDLMVDVFGEKGKHARAAVSTPSLPLGAAVEVDGIFEIG